VGRRERERADAEAGVFLSSPRPPPKRRSASGPTKKREAAAANTDDAPSPKRSSRHTATPAQTGIYHLPPRALPPEGISDIRSSNSTSRIVLG